MKTAKEIAVISVFVALLIGGQLALSGVAGVEVVTVLAVSFCYFFGVLKGVICLTAFSLLRCFIFGFTPNVVVLYLVYYCLIALLFGTIGKKFGREITLKKLVVITLVCALSTALFTLLDDVISPLIYGFNLSATKAYFLASIPTMITQVICATVTTALLFYPLIKIYKTVRI